LGNELDSATGTLGAGVSGMMTINVSSLSNIAYVIFLGEGFNTQNNVYADNLSFTTTPAVPLPAGLVLMGSALAGFGLIRRKG
ncbi:MAG: VPLPA-CTERM sorting domain-containing protein, partial [Pseudomonadota bacterium]|nr:VPLPA-CTERM sorting domain-containing protein [Pseudomonadota bacterium]